MNRLSKLTRLYPLITLIVFLSSCTMIRQMVEFKEERYETGAFKGSESCKECHKEIYDQWKTSQHANATRDEWFLELKHTLPVPVKLMMGDKPCYACHGPEELNEGVTCEVCHGVNDQEDTDLLHKQKYTSNLASMQKAEFCGKCHEAVNPMSGEAMMATYTEWEQSQASKEGKQCSDCHMNSNDSEPAFHGFSSKFNDITIYNDDFQIKNIKFTFPDFSLDIENNTVGHYLPAGGPEPILFLRVDLQDISGKTIHSFTEEFKSLFTIFIGMPYKKISDTRLRDGEIRTVNFSVPEELKGIVSKAKVSLKLFDVDHRLKGDITKARWESKSFYEKTFILTEL